MYSEFQRSSAAIAFGEAEALSEKHSTNRAQEFDLGSRSSSRKSDLDVIVSRAARYEGGPYCAACIMIANERELAEMSMAAVTWVQRRMYDSGARLTHPDLWEGIDLDSVGTVKDADCHMVVSHEIVDIIVIESLDSPRRCLLAELFF